MTDVAESSLRIGGMHCAACADIIESALRRQLGVVEARVSAAAQSATVRWDPAVTTAAAVLKAVRDAGYEAAPDTAVEARAARTRESRMALWRLFVAAFCAMQVMMMAAPAYFSAPGELPLEGLDAALRSLGLTGVALTGPPPPVPLLGTDPAGAFAERVRGAIDPERRFLELSA